MTKCGKEKLPKGNNPALHGTVLNTERFTYFVVSDEFITGGQL